MENPSINELPDDLLVTILSWLPSFKETVATILISKRWKGLWKQVPNLMLDDESCKSSMNFKSFVDKSLSKKNPLVLERLHLTLGFKYSTSDINGWFQSAVHQSVREVRINLFDGELELPSCLSTCTTLTKLIFYRLSIEVSPPCFQLPSLKTLHLYSVKFSRDEAVASLLRNCPVLEDLVVNRNPYDNVMIFNINVPTLKSLSIENSKWQRGYSRFVIEVPSLRSLNIKDIFSKSIVFEDMPKVVKAKIEVICGQSKEFMRSLTSIKLLSLCCQTLKTPYPRGTTFRFLLHLELCKCSMGWWNLLGCILNDAPRLESLKLSSQHCARETLTRKDKKISRHHDPWNKPECLSTHLVTLDWRQYEGTKDERKVAAYILERATRLKKATFSPRWSCYYLWMVDTVEKMHRVSKTCQLVFEETLL